MKIIMQDPWGIRSLGFYDNSLCEALHKKNKDLKLITNFYYEYGQLSNFEVEKIFFRFSENLKVNILRKIIRGLEYCLNMFILLRKYSIESPDIIHIQWLLFYQFDYFWLRILRYKLRNKNTKLVLTAHNILPHINGFRYKKILNKIYSNFDGLIVHSKVLKTQMIEIFGIKASKWPICVTSIGIGEQLLAKVDQNILNSYRNKISKSRSNGRHFLFAGIIHKNKGLDILLKAWEGHINKFPNDKLYIVGNPTYNMDDESKYIQRHGTSIETSFGYKSDEELLAYYLESDFVVLPYKEASQSGVLFTAFTLGKPVIVTKVGGIPEVVDIIQGGYIVEPNDPGLLYAAINKAAKITNSELTQWNNEIREKTIEHYSWDNIAKITLDFYHKIFNIPNNYHPK